MSHVLPVCGAGLLLGRAALLLLGDEHSVALGLTLVHNLHVVRVLLPGVRAGWGRGGSGWFQDVDCER